MYLFIIMHYSGKQNMKKKNKNCPEKQRIYFFTVEYTKNIKNKKTSLHFTISEI